MEKERGGTLRTQGEEEEEEKEEEKEEEEEEEDYGVTEQVDQFFTELDLDQEQRRRRLRSEGIRVCINIFIYELNTIL